MESGNEFPAQAVEPFDKTLLAYMKEEQKGRKCLSIKCHTPRKTETKM